MNFLTNRRLGTAVVLGLLILFKVLDLVSPNEVPDNILRQHAREVKSLSTAINSVELVPEQESRLVKKMHDLEESHRRREEEILHRSQKLKRSQGIRLLVLIGILVFLVASWSRETSKSREQGDVDKN